MDHLSSHQEKIDRWYAKQTKPRYVPVKPARSWEDLLLEEDTAAYDCVRSVPFEFLAEDAGVGGSRGGVEESTASECNVSGREEISIRLQKVLERHGFLVVSGVLGEEDCRKGIDLAWDWIEAASVAEKIVADSGQNNDRNANNNITESPGRPSYGSSTGTASNSSSNNKDDKRDSDDHNDSTSSCITGIDDGSGSKDKDGISYRYILPLKPPVRRDDRSTLTSRYFPKAVEGGIQPFYGSGHSSFAWHVRSHPNLIEVFRCLYGSPNVLSSLDGFILWRTERPITDVGWFHLDQNPKLKPKRKGVYQGLVNLLPVTPQTGGNVLVAESQRHFPDHYLKPGQHDSNSASDVSRFYRQRLEEVGSDDWLEIDPGDSEILQPSRILCLLLQPGDVLLWDSHLVHCSHPPSPTDACGGGDDDGDGQNRCPGGTPDVGLTRAVTLVTMVPVDDEKSEPPSSYPMPREDVLEARKCAVHNSRTLTNWIDKVAPLGEERAEQVALERQRVQIMQIWQDERQQQKQLSDSQSLARRNVLLGWDDLTESQKQLVVGISKNRRRK